MSRLASRALAACLLLAASCRGVPLPETEPVHDEAARRALLRELCPPAVPATMVQRWVISDRGQEMFFTVYARLEPLGSLRVAVLSDFGGTLASGAWTDGAPRSDEAQGPFPARWTESILSMLALVFLPGPPDGYELARLADGKPALQRAHEEFRWADGKETRIAAGKGRTEATAVVTAWADAQGVRYPASLKLSDRTRRLEATVDVVRFDVLAAEDPRE